MPNYFYAHGYYFLNPKIVVFGRKEYMNEVLAKLMDINFLSSPQITFCSDVRTSFNTLFSGTNLLYFNGFTTVRFFYSFH
jgi:hypothetical protein